MLSAYFETNVGAFLCGDRIVFFLSSFCLDFDGTCQ